MKSYLTVIESEIIGIKAKNKKEAVKLLKLKYPKETHIKEYHLVEVKIFY